VLAVPAEEERWLLFFFMDDVNFTALHYHMFVPAIEGQASEAQQRAWLPEARALRWVGCYAQTEMGHGSNVQGLETTATFVPEADAWEIHSPTLTSTKARAGLGLLSCSPPPASGGPFPAEPRQGHRRMQARGRISLLPFLAAAEACGWYDPGMPLASPVVLGALSLVWALQWWPGGLGKVSPPTPFCTLACSCRGRGPAGSGRPGDPRYAAEAPLFAA